MGTGGSKLEGKACYKCNEWKPLEKFPADKRQKDGRRSYCKACRNKRTREIYQENPEPKRKYRQEWKGKNAEHLANWKKQYQLKNAEMLKEKKRQYYLNNKEVLNQKTMIYYRKNKSKILDYSHNRYNKLKDKINEQRRLERQTNPEIREKERLYWEARPEQKRQKERNWRNNNIDKVRNLKRQWYKTDKGKETSYRASLKRRSFKHKVAFTPHERKTILDRDNWTCQYCGRKVHDRNTGNWNTEDKAHIDHIIPLTEGGTSEPSNLQVLCRTCNLSKSNKLKDKIKKQLTFDLFENTGN
jgi:5-methylcytosine-specific restriction endonuclease McrA